MTDLSLKDRLYARELIIRCRMAFTVKQISEATGLSRKVLYRLYNVEPCRLWGLPVQQLLERIRTIAEGNHGQAEGNDDRADHGEDPAGEPRRA
jgi:hypothetical protein